MNARISAAEEARIQCEAEANAAVAAAEAAAESSLERARVQAAQEKEEREETRKGGREAEGKGRMGGERSMVGKQDGLKIIISGSSTAAGSQRDMRTGYSA